mgnify:CR=1 FL=1
MIAQQERTPGTIAARLIGALAIGSAAFLVLRPFIIPMLWSAILAYVTWPLYQRLAERTRHRQLAAALFALLVALAFGIPVALLLVNLATEVADIAGKVIAWQQAGAPLPSSVPPRSRGPRNRATRSMPSPVLEFGSCVAPETT